MLTLNDVPYDLFEKITISSLDEMTGQITISSKLPFYEAEYSDDSIANIKSTIKSILLKLVYTTNSNEETFLNALGSDQKKLLVENVNTRKLDIALSLLKQHNAQIRPVIDTFDWKVKWIIGTSSSTTLRYPLICLDFITLNYVNEVPTRKNISLELNKDELERLISVLEEYQALRN